VRPERLGILKGRVVWEILSASSEESRFRGEKLGGDELKKDSVKRIGRKVAASQQNGRGRRDMHR